MATEISHRKITVFLLYHHNYYGKFGIDISDVELKVTI